jgi:2-methylcitrate dehydratase PrpD
MALAEGGFVLLLWLPSDACSRCGDRQAGGKAAFDATHEIEHAEHAGEDGGQINEPVLQQGFVGTHKIYEGADGLFRSHTGSQLDAVDVAAMTRNLGTTWLIDEVAVKPYPICHLLHACADAALALRNRHKLQPRDIASVRALLHPETFHYVAEPADMRRRPVSDYMAKFSVQFVVAACLVRGRFGFAELQPDALNDPEILGLAQRVSHDKDPDSLFPRYFSGGVVVTLRDGREFVHMEKINRGAGERTLGGEEIIAKFMDNAELVVSRPRARQICEFVLGLHNHSVRELGRLLAGH